MTNEMIIFNEGQRLAAEGKISYTGREFQVKADDGTVQIIKETEPIHTFATWKTMGMKVKKGEHAVTKLVIWKHTEKENEDGEKDTKMFMKTAHFFSASQVEVIA